MNLLFKNGVVIRMTLLSAVIAVVLISAAAADTGETTFPEIPPAFLHFSDHPERVTGRGLLYGGAVSRTGPVRFHFYHQGNTEIPDLTLVLAVVNLTGNKAELVIRKSEFEPGKDAFTAGRRSASSYLRARESGTGEILNINPGETAVISEIKLPPDEVISGYMDMALLSGGPVNFGLFALSSPEETFSFPPPGAEGDVHSWGAYTLTDVRLLRKYRIPDPDLVITIGDAIVDTVVEGRHLRGSYGIVQEIDLVLENPLAGPGTVNIFFQPRGGTAAFTAFLDGNLISVPPTGAYQQVLLARVLLKPYGVKKIRLLTMPQGASNYPVILKIKGSGSKGEK
ncbi:MAG: hypothetical protein M1269_02800 [Chloroflexi bacterium]|nr:hypothetical protein [Chloroflexota bacterium]